MLRRRFRAMGTDVELLLDVEAGDLAEAALARARDEIERLEARLSRFRPDSELSRLNRTGAAPPSPELAGIVTLSLALRTRTGGLFDPAVGRAVRAAGYDRSFESLRDRDESPEAGPPGGGGVVVAGDGSIRLAPGVELDLGGVAKGVAADRACALLSVAGPALVNVGGDLAAGGPRRDGPWTVSLETGDGALTLALPHGGLATSGLDRRRWRRAGRWQHHVIDPRTGSPSRTDLVRATAVAPSAGEAEAMATALLVAGAGPGAALANGWSVPAVLVPRQGPAVLAGGVA